MEPGTCRNAAGLLGTRPLPTLTRRRCSEFGMRRAPGVGCQWEPNTRKMRPRHWRPPRRPVVRHLLSTRSLSCPCREAPHFGADSRLQDGPTASMPSEVAPLGAGRVLPGSNCSPSGHRLPSAGTGSPGTHSQLPRHPEARVPHCLSSELSHVLLRPCTPDRGPRGWRTARVQPGVCEQRSTSPATRSHALGRALFLPHSSAGPLGRQVTQCLFPGDRILSAVATATETFSPKSLHQSKVREQGPGWAWNGCSELTLGWPGLGPSGLRNVHQERSSLSLRSAGSCLPLWTGGGLLRVPLHPPPLQPGGAVSRLAAHSAGGRRLCQGHRGLGSRASTAAEPNPEHQPCGRSQGSSGGLTGPPGSPPQWPHGPTGQPSAGPAWPPACPPEPSTSPGAAPGEQQVRSVEHRPCP